MAPMTDNAWLVAAGIMLSAWVSEDGAIVAAAALASVKAVDLSVAAFAAVFGLWISDFGVYAAVRLAREKLPERSGHWLSARLRVSETLVRRRSHLGLALSRAVPGTRFPAYVSAGFFRMPVTTFAGITAASALLWTAFVFAAVHLFPIQSRTTAEALTWAGFTGVIVFLAITAWRIWGGEAIIILKKWRRWEFWPAWLFYPPVALMCVWLAIRFRGLSLPTVANPGQRNGGIVGESKIEILRDLMRTSPEFTADAYLIAPGALAQRLEELELVCLQREIRFPFVLKPDTAQRGAGFRKIRSWQEAGAYLSKVNAAVLLQRYVKASNEAGVFYYRQPGEERGETLSITRKEFPFVMGDGVQTVEQLIRADERAALIAGTYLRRFGDRARHVVPAGERVRLVEAGNHCQGCIFHDGADLNTEELRAAFDQIAAKLPGFFVGRFDVRYEKDEDLRNGRDFKIIELNGAASEATSIYDSRNSLRSAYATLYRQWQLIYAIGAVNQDRGIRPSSALDVLRDWKQFHKQARYYPLAD